MKRPAPAKHTSMAKPPAGSGPMAQPGRAGGAISIKPPASLKGFGHAVPEVKPITTDRGSFKIKG